MREKQRMRTAFIARCRRCVALRRGDQRAGAGGHAAADGRYPPQPPQRRRLRHVARRRHGLGAVADGRAAVRAAEHVGRRAGRRRHGRCPRLSHGPLGTRPGPARGGRGDSPRAAECPTPGHCTDPCDGRTQGTPGMFDSLAYRNDAASIFRRLARSIPHARGVLGVATCDKGLPAMMMALASLRRMPCVLLPGGVMLPPSAGEDTGKIQSIGARYVHGEISLEAAADMGCHVCASPGGGCHFLGTAATAQVVGEALGLTLPHAALAPSGQPIWLDMARRSAQALLAMERRGTTIGDMLSDASVRNAMAVFAAFGGSTNLLDPPAGHRLFRRSAAADHRRLDRGEPPRAAPGVGAAQRAGRPPDGPRLPGRRRARGHAAAPRPGPAGTRRHDRQRPDPRRGARMVGDLAAARGAAGAAPRSRRRRSRRRDYDARRRPPRWA